MLTTPEQEHRSLDSKVLLQLSVGIACVPLHVVHLLHLLVLGTYSIAYLLKRLPYGTFIVIALRSINQLIPCLQCPLHSLTSF